jgi:Mu-like prophage I protein
MVNLVTVPNIELMKTGTWEISTGKWTVTPELIAAAVAAHNSGALRKPVIKLGHNDERFTGDPALGFIDNLHVSEDGNTLYGDMIGVPEGLAKIMPSAYPDRSVEGMYDYTAPDGSDHPFILTGLALLGATGPGVKTLKSLQDVENIYEIDIAAAVKEVGGTPIQFVMAADKKPYGDVEYADTKDGKYPIDTAEHTRAAWSYINMPKNQKGYSPTELAAIKSKIKAAAKKFGITIEASAASQPEGVAAMALPESVAQKLGIAADADEATIMDALEALNAPEAPAPEPAVPEAPAPAAEPAPVPVAASDGLMRVDPEAYNRLVAAAEAGQRAEARQIAEDDDRIVLAAIKDGRVPPARKEHWLTALRADREGTKTVLASLAPGLVPVTEQGHGVGYEGDRSADNDLENTFNRVMASAGYPITKGGN